MSKRSQNESKFTCWTELSNGGRRYWLDVLGRSGWRARYLKEVDAFGQTVRFWQKTYDESDTLREIHENYPIDHGHKRL